MTSAKPDKGSTSEIIRAMLKRAGVSASRTSLNMGKKSPYIDSILSRGSNPRCDVMATIADTLGYELVVRDRNDGYEFIIPPM